MKQRMKLLSALFVIGLFAAVAGAQVAAGGNYALEQSVIASGGGTSTGATGNTFSATGAIGQSITDTSSASPFTVKSGFFSAAAPLAPTAAKVSISGRVTTISGRGIINVRLTLIDAGGQVRTATTTTFGYYRFNDVVVGATYILTATGKRYTFNQPIQVLNVNDETTEVNFTANP